jgi:hypothetical protein
MSGLCVRKFYCTDVFRFPYSIFLYNNDFPIDFSTTLHCGTPYVETYYKNNI